MGTVGEVLEKMEERHLLGIRELYCRPDRQNIGSLETREELAEFGIYNLQRDPKHSPMTHFGYRVAHHLLDVGKFPSESS